MSTGLVVVSGTLWSGSSAISDILFEYEGVGRQMPRFNAETAFTKGIYSLSHIHGLLRAHAPVTLSDLRQLGQFMLGEAAAFPTRTSTLELNLRRNLPAVTYYGKPYTELVGRLLHQLDPLVSAPPAARMALFEQAVSEFYGGLGDAVPERNYLGGQRRYLVLNNDPNAGTTSFYSVMPMALAVIVLRDPRDVFANACLRNYYEPTVNAAQRYSAMFKQRLEGIVAEYRFSRFGGRPVRFVEFERLVSRPEDHIRALTYHLSLDRRLDSRFDASVSVKKVGIAEGLLPEVRAVLEMAAVPTWRNLREFLMNQGIMLVRF